MNKPYIDYTFTGVRTFTDVLDEALVSYRVFAPEKSSFLFESASEYLDQDTDTLAMGTCTRGNQELYYLQVGMKITKSFLSHIVFIYDHEPDNKELNDTLMDILSLTESTLDSVQDEISPTLMEEAQQKHTTN